MLSRRPGCVKTFGGRTGIILAEEFILQHVMNQTTVNRMTTSTIEPINDELPVDQNPIPAPVPIPEPGPEATPVLDGQELVSFSKKYPQEEPLNQLDGADLRTLLRSAFDWLAHHQEMINRLNVFPVPDGDTGTNMLLTVRSAWAEIVKRGGQSASSVMKAAADGAHQGSRGNSGVILGRIFQGMSEALSEVPHMTQENLMAAMRSATEKAYKSVPTPVEGTILTVVREISAAADRAGQRKDDLRAMLAHMVESGDEAVRRTPDQLPVLKKAGVVDSGGKGLFFLFEGMYRAISGQPVAKDAATAAAIHRENLAAAAEQLAYDTGNKGHRDLPKIEWGFDVQFLIERPNKSVEAIRADIEAMGDCPLVDGNEHLVKVHVHVFDPGIALSYGINLGFMTDVVVENMDDMALTAHIGMDSAESLEGSARFKLAQDLPEAGDVGLVVVSPGPGLDDLFFSLRAHCVVSGGQTMNPSTRDLVAAVLALPCRRAIILPNNRNIIMAANQAADLLAQGDDPREVTVVSSRTVPQGSAALIAFNLHASNLTVLSAQMSAAMTPIRTGEVTEAVRDVDLDGLAVRVGEIIGLQDGVLVTKGAEIDATALDLLAHMIVAESEFITIYYGGSIDAQSAQAFAAQVEELYPDQEIELIFGGQPYYHYILSSE